MKKKSIVGAVGAAAIAGQAHAAVWLLNYAATNGAGPSEASLTLQTADALGATGGYDVLSISGQVDGELVSGLVANPNGPSAAYSADGLFIYDNVFYANGSPVLSNPGLLFSGVSGHEFNLFSDNATTYELYKATSGAGYQGNSLGVLSYDRQQPGAVPEPATWTMLILGFGFVGTLLRRRQHAPAIRS